MGPLRRADIPLSAVDFHVSGIVEDIMKQAPVERAAELAAERFHCRTGDFIPLYVCGEEEESK